MQICIHSQFLGTQKNLLYDTVEKNFCWSDDRPVGAWVLGSPDSELYDIKIIASLMGRDIVGICRPAQERAYRSLGYTDPIPWQKVLPTIEFQAGIVDLINELEMTLDEFERTGYGDTFLVGRKVLKNLSRASLNVEQHSLCTKQEHNPTLRKTLATFRPGIDGLAQPVKGGPANWGRAI